MDCGVYCLADAGMDLKRLLRIAEARRQLNDALIHQSSPVGMVRAMTTILESSGQGSACELAVQMPGDGWRPWTILADHPEPREPSADWHHICLLGHPAMVLAIRGQGSAQTFDPDMEKMVREFAESMRPWVDQLLESQRQALAVAALNTAALCDPLTGLANRRALAEAKLPASYSLIELDLDHFKQINDSFGHDAGDRVLEQLARVLRESVREQDQTFRLCGEEFLVLLPEADQATALMVAERIRLSMHQLDLAGAAPEGRLTVSLGVSTKSAQLNFAFTQLMELADQALYAGKEAGRDRVRAAEALSLSSR